MSAKAIEWKTAAQMELSAPAKWTPEGREAIAAWLRKMADHVESGTDNLEDDFVARYCYQRGFNDVPDLEHPRDMRKALEVYRLGS